MKTTQNGHTTTERQCIGHLQEKVLCFWRWEEMENIFSRSENRIGLPGRSPSVMYKEARGQKVTTGTARISLHELQTTTYANEISMNAAIAVLVSALDVIFK